MRFGDVAVDSAQGTILAHSLKLGKLRFKKGRLLSAEDVAQIREAGISSVIAASLAPGDVPENDAAGRLGDAMRVSGVKIAPPATGRVNVFAAHNGLFRADKALIDRLNRIDPAITFACLADHTQVAKGAMVATIKIIPLAVAGVSLDRAIAAIAEPELIAVRPFRAMRTGLVSTMLPTLKPSVMDKTALLLQERLDHSGSRVTGELRVVHDATVVAEAVRQSVAANDLVILFGASAVVDAEDVLPSAIRLAGGEVQQVGMPVDPGNLLVLGHVGGVPVIGAPGCARSPKENGFDWVLARLLAGEPPTHEDITAMGVGGLLMEIPSRPQPRESAENGDPPVEIVMLAAGQARRMGTGNGHKLLANFDGEPLVRRMAGRARASKAAAVHVVTGHRSDEIRQALSGLDVDLVDNPDFATGMASSLISGLSRISGRSGGVLVMLADMPAIRTADLDALIEGFRESSAKAIVRAVSGGKRGNPVILPRAAFDAVRRLSGDVGARTIVESGAFDIVDVEIGTAAHVDVDTPDAVKAAGGVLSR